MNDLYIGIGSVFVGVMFLMKYALSGSQRVSSKVAKKMLKSKDITKVIDVRTKLEYDVGHHPGSTHIPLGSLNAESMRGTRKNTGILVYCNTGQRARVAAELLRSMGYSNVYYISGHYTTLK
jgi:rhodanese-related sulfurtransferase